MSSERVIPGAGEGAVFLEVFGVESTKVVNRNCPNEDVPPAMTLAWPPDIDAILILRSVLPLSSHRVVCVFAALPPARDVMERAESLGANLGLW